MFKCLLSAYAKSRGMTQYIFNQTFDVFYLINKQLARERETEKELLVGT